MKKFRIFYQTKLGGLYLMVLLLFPVFRPVVHGTGIKRSKSSEFLPFDEIYRLLFLGFGG